MFIKINYSLLVVLAVPMGMSSSFAGNPSRSGSAGATELLINPWPRSSGWAGANMAGARGLEAMYLNIAGASFTRSTELLLANTRWPGEIDINSFGLTQRVGEASVMGFGVMAMSFGKIKRTTVDVPENDSSYFSPAFTNLGLSYSREFSKNIYAGITTRVISQRIADVRAFGATFDMGIQYVTGLTKKHTDNLKFGISLKNVGTTMHYSGDGLAFKGQIVETGMSLTLQPRSQSFLPPSLLNIGLSYDFHFGGNDSLNIASMHRLTAAGTFVADAFNRDKFLLGAEYSYKEMLMVRGGFVYEDGVFNSVERSTFLTGPTAGITFEIPLRKEKGTTFAIDYSYRATQPFQGIHSLGARINI